MVEKALLNAKAEELRSQVNGVKKLFTSLAHSVANFRETGNITYDQALAFYDHGFTVTSLINMKILVWLNVFMDTVEKWPQELQIRCAIF